MVHKITMILSLILALSTPLQAAIHEGLVGHWTLDSVASTTQDNSGNGNTATLNNGPSLVAGKIGAGALQFDTANSNLTIPHSATLSGMSTLTVSLWVNLNQSGLSGSLISKRQTGPPYASYDVGINASNQITFSVTNQNQTIVSTRGATSLLTHQWYHILALYDGVNLHIYVNNRLDDAYVRSISGNIFNSNSSLIVHYASTARVLIDDIRIYNRNLSEGDIQLLYNQGQPLIPVNGLCGSAAKAYGAGDSFPQGEYCSTGITNPTTPNALSAGSSTTWICEGSNGGADSTCSATMAAVQPPLGSQRVDLLDTFNRVINSFTGNNALQSCAYVITAGQTCFVQPGVYDERVSITRSGTRSEPIIFKANGSSVVVRGFTISSASDVLIDGFEITNQAMSLDTANSIIISNSTRIQILNNYIHHTRGGFIQTGNCSFITIRANTGTYADYWNPNINAQGKQTRNQKAAYTGTFGQPDADILIERNLFSNVGDFINPYGTRFVIRNNTFGPSQDEVTDHIDGVQANGMTTDSLVEGNLSVDNHNSDNHFLLNQTVGSDRWIIRYNVTNRSKGGQDWRNVNRYYFYNNTFYDNYSYYPSGFQILLTNSTGNLARNNIWYRSVSTNGNPYSVGTGSGIDKDHDLWFNSGNPQESNGINTDPLFVNPGSGDFNLNSTSTAINRGGALTTTINSANIASTSLQVNNSGAFQPGWAGVQADWVAVCPATGCGHLANQTAQISSISGNTITLNTPLTWGLGDHVYLFKDSNGRQVLYGTKPDLGAYEYNSSTPLNSSPTISNIANQSTDVDFPTSAISFTIGDAQTSASSLTLSGKSSQPSLVPDGNIVFGGSGSDRTVTVRPASGQTGRATITITVSDGQLLAEDTFELTVNTPAVDSIMDCTQSNILCVNNDPTLPIANATTKEFSTIQSCANVVAAGQTCLIHSGTYDERVTVINSGNPQGGYINFVGNAHGPKPIMRGFSLSAKSYIRIIGFEITHNSTAYSHGITLGASSDHIEILNNHIHHVYRDGIAWFDNSTNAYITIRGNEIYHTACPNMAGACVGNGMAFGAGGGRHLLVEYNEAHRVGDFMNIHAKHTMTRNNYLHDFHRSYWPDASTFPHPDMFQPGSTAATIDPDFLTQYQIYESNFMGDNNDTDAHILQMRSTNDEHHIIFRGNVAYENGQYIMQSAGIDNVYFYNNTFHRMNTFDATRNNGGIRYNAEAGNPSVGNYNFNNIYSLIGRSPINVDSDGSAVVSSHNLCFGNTGTHASCLFSADPAFVDPATDSFFLLSHSAAIGAAGNPKGKAVTTVTTPSSSGTSFDAADASLLSDGWGIAEGDIIKVGTNPPVRIKSILGNTITVNQAITWNKDDGIYWRNQDGWPDIGAYEYRAGGYTINHALNYTDADQVPQGLVRLISSVNDQSLVRFVEFWIDGLPVAIDYDAPYEYNWDTRGLSLNSTHQIKAIARPLFASSTLGYEDQATVTITQALVVAGNGDASGDGKVTMYDAALVLRYTLGSALSDVQKQKADMNADGKIDGGDVLAIGRKALGL